MDKLQPDDVAFRSAEPDDVAFLMSSFVQSFANDRDVRRAGETLGLNPNETKDQVRALWSLLQGFEVAIACDPSDRSTIFGYCVYRPGVVGWLYVRYRARGLGVGSMLLRHCGFEPFKSFAACFPRTAPIAAFRARGWMVDINPYCALLGAAPCPPSAP